MKSFLKRWVITTLAVLVAIQIVPGISYDTRTGLLIATLLLGVLNAYGEDLLHDDDGLVVRALALLGEIGDAAAMPALAKFVPLEDDTMGGAARWAFLRIARRRPDEALDVIRHLSIGAEALDLAAALDRPIEFSETRPLTAAEKCQWERTKRRPGRPRRGNGARVISLSVEQTLLEQADRAAQNAGLSRAALFEMGLRNILKTVRRKAG